MVNMPYSLLVRFGVERKVTLLFFRRSPSKVIFLHILHTMEER